MASAPSDQFIVEPITATEWDAPDLVEALAAHQALIAAIMAKTPDLNAFLAADKAFSEAVIKTAALHPVAVDFRPGDCWYVNLIARSFASAGITADSVRDAIDLLTRAIDARWWDCLALRAKADTDKAALQQIINEALQEAALMLWWLFNTKSLEGDIGERATGFERVALFMDHANNIARSVAMLSREFPLADVANDLQAQGWRFNIYRLSMSLLGFQPV